MIEPAVEAAPLPEVVEQWLSLADAAHFMGITTDALRKRVARGTVTGRKVDGRTEVRV